MRYLYYCNSTYQLLNILNLHYQRKNLGFENIDNYSADLIITNAFSYAEEIYKAIKKQNVFSRIYLLDKPKDNGGVFHTIISASEIISPSIFIKNKFGLNRKLFSNRYDVITTPKFSGIVAAIWQLNKNCKLHLYEDGLASYYLDSDLIVSRSKSYKTLYKPCNYGRDFWQYEYMYLCEPQIYTGDYSERVRGIPKFNNNCLSSLNDALCEFSKPEEDRKILWFAQAMFDDKKVLKILEKYKDEVLFRPHPRYPEDVGIFTKTSEKRIWELQALNTDNLDNKCLIAIHSTALLTPKLLFDKEPYIIFVSKIVDLPYDFDFFGKSLMLFKESYRDKEKIMFPETMEEFEDCIKKVLNV